MRLLIKPKFHYADFPVTSKEETIDRTLVHKHDVPDDLIIIMMMVVIPVLFNTFSGIEY